jgi:hypothetical protein
LNHWSGVTVLVLIRQHERQVEDLDVQLTFDKPITGSGAIMTLPAATADLKDWMQVIGDFRDSLAKTGPKLSRHVEPITSRIESRLSELISTSVPDPVFSVTDCDIPAAVRSA